MILTKIMVQEEYGAIWRSGSKPRENMIQTGEVIYRVEPLE